jgi:hypothetical protein
MELIRDKSAHEAQSRCVVAPISVGKPVIISRTTISPGDIYLRVWSL